MLTTSGLQVTESGFHIGVPKPFLHSSKVFACRQMPRRKCRSELMKPKMIRIELGVSGRHFLQHV